MENLIEKLDKRKFIFLLTGIALIIFSAMFSYLLWPKFTSYKKSIDDLAVLEEIIASKNDVKYELGSLKTEIDRTKRKLRGDMADLPEKEMEAYVIGVLQNISWDNDVELIGVKPAKGSKINIFQEILFKVKLAGEYHDLYHWFIELRTQLGFIVIKNLNLNPVNTQNDSTPLRMDLTIASYKSIHK